MPTEPLKSRSPLYQTTDAETYDAWFVRQVEEGLREADDPNTVWTGSEDVFRTIDQRLHSVREQVALKKAS